MEFNTMNPLFALKLLHKIYISLSLSLFIYRSLEISFYVDRCCVPAAADAASM